MSERLNHGNNLSDIRASEYNKEMQLLNNMEAVHLRKKAAFDELLRYTFNNAKDSSNKDNDHKTT